MRARNSMSLDRVYPRSTAAVAIGPTHSRRRDAGKPPTIEARRAQLSQSSAEVDEGGSRKTRPSENSLKTILSAERVNERRRAVFSAPCSEPARVMIRAYGSRKHGGLHTESQELHC